MQASDVAPPNVWLEIVRSPATVLAAMAAALRLVVWPAVLTLLRRDLRPELQKLGELEAAVVDIRQRLGTTEAALELLQNVPVSLARIEEQLKALLELRRASPAPERS